MLAHTLVLSHINCETLDIEIRNSQDSDEESLNVDMQNSRDIGDIIFTDADIDLVTEVLKERVENLQIRLEEYGGLFPIIEKYDGKGTCHEIRLRYDKIKSEKFQFEYKKVEKWATSRGWTYKYEKTSRGWAYKYEKTVKKAYNRVCYSIHLRRISQKIF